MQSMTMTLSKRCMYAKLHVIWSKSMLYIFSLSSHIDRIRIQACICNSTASVQKYIWDFQSSLLRFDWKWLSFENMTQRHRNYSEEIRQIKLLNFKDIQNYYAVELSRKNSEKIIIV
jgi:hypothetical protein